MDDDTLELELDVFDWLDEDEDEDAPAATATLISSSGSRRHLPCDGSPLNDLIRRSNLSVSLGIQYFVESTVIDPNTFVPTEGITITAIGDVKGA